MSKHVTPTPPQITHEEYRRSDLHAPSGDAARHFEPQPATSLVLPPSNVSPVDELRLMLLAQPGRRPANQWRSTAHEARGAHCVWCGMVLREQWDPYNDIFRYDNPAMGGACRPNPTNDLRVAAARLGVRAEPLLYALSQGISIGEIAASARKYRMPASVMLGWLLNDALLDIAVGEGVPYGSA